MHLRLLHSLVHHVHREYVIRHHVLLLVGVELSGASVVHSRTACVVSWLLAWLETTLAVFHELHELFEEVRAGVDARKLLLFPLLSHRHLFLSYLFRSMEEHEFVAVEDGLVDQLQHVWVRLQFVVGFIGFLDGLEVGESVSSLGGAFLSSDLFGPELNRGDLAVLVQDLPQLLLGDVGVERFEEQIGVATLPAVEDLSLPRLFLLGVVDVELLACVFDSDVVHFSQGIACLIGVLEKHEGVKLSELGI